MDESVRTGTAPAPDQASVPNPRSYTMAPRRPTITAAPGKPPEAMPFSRMRPITSSRAGDMPTSSGGRTTRPSSCNDATVAARIKARNTVRFVAEGEAGRGSGSRAGGERTDRPATTTAQVPTGQDERPLGAATGDGQPPVPSRVTEHMDPMPPTDQITIRRAINGDEAALRAIWEQHAPRVDAIVRRLVGDPDLAADVAQEVWIQIFRALPSYRGESQFSTWTHRIAVNRTLNALRSLRRLSKSEVELDEHTSLVEHEGDRALLAQTIDEAVQQLSPG